MTELRARGGGDFGFESGFTILVLDRAAIARLNLPGGMVYTWTRNLMAEIKETAQLKLFPGHGFVTGELQRSVDFSVTPTGGSVVGNVRATSAHAIYYHQGYRGGYEIAPNPPNRALRWVDDRGFHFAKRVFRKEGFTGRPFLREAMEEVLAAHGITR